MNSATRGPYPSCGCPRPRGLPAPAPGRGGPKTHMVLDNALRWVWEGPFADKKLSLTSADQLVQNRQLQLGPGVGQAWGWLGTRTRTCVRVSLARPVRPVLHPQGRVGAVACRPGNQAGPPRACRSSLDFKLNATLSEPTRPNFPSRKSGRKGSLAPERGSPGWRAEGWRGGDPRSPPGPGPLLQGASGRSRWAQPFLTLGAAALSCLPTGV